MLIVIEGVDGAGKRTLTNRLREAFQADGHSVANLAFPRYRASVPADLAAEALHGNHGDLDGADSCVFRSRFRLAKGADFVAQLGAPDQHPGQFYLLMLQARLPLCLGAYCLMTIMATNTGFQILGNQVSMKT